MDDHQRDFLRAMHQHHPHSPRNQRGGNQPDTRRLDRLGMNTQRTTHTNVPCRTCAGDGTITVQDGSWHDPHMQQWYPRYQEIDCPQCNGTGNIVTLVCLECRLPARDCACNES